jgi:hypothetical protein
MVISSHAQAELYFCPMACIHQLMGSTFRNGWAYFCHMNKIVAGSLLVVRVEMREECIGLFVTKIR